MDETIRKKRAGAILELVKSDRDYVKNLKDVTEGYLQPARRHPEIFTIERINTIFSNIEQLYEFQCKFLSQLEKCIHWDDPASSNVGHCFLEHQKSFAVYYYYCNNHPNAISELQDMYGEPKFVRFFEACRLLQKMIDISLDGFLLTPIQKICRYPLQLSELLKYTPENHSDYEDVRDALECVRSCANLANERKRRIEALADIMQFQEKFDNWFGPKLCETSSILIHSGEVSKMSSNNWSQGIHLHLFDHLLLYSKKDILKRNSLVLKGRICLDVVSDISETEERGKRGFKLYDRHQSRWFVFATKSSKEQEEWLNAFERERKLVEADEEEGFQITKREINVARRTLNSRKLSRSARYRTKKPDTAVVDQLDIDEAATIMNRTLSLPSSIHPGHVLNFVQDSKVISDRKNTSSSISSNHNNSDPTTNNSTSSSNWFKKVGSKRLHNKQSDEDKSSAVEVTYDQLQRRHESIMICAERARLYRLNNNLPVIDPKLINSSNFGIVQNSPMQRLHSSSRQTPPIELSRSKIVNEIDIPDLETDMQAINLHQEDNQSHHQMQSNDRGTFDETTVVLSSGRLVRVRENAV